MFPVSTGFTLGRVVCAHDETRSNSEVIPCGPTLELFNSDAQNCFNPLRPGHFFNRNGL